MDMNVKHETRICTGSRETKRNYQKKGSLERNLAKTEEPLFKMFSARGTIGKLIETPSREFSWMLLLEVVCIMYISPRIQRLM
jgi:hypothetical protein